MPDGWVRYKDAGRDGLSHDEEHASSAPVNLHILFTYGLVGRGGDAVQVLEMAEALRNLGHTVRLVGPEPLRPYESGTSTSKLRTGLRSRPWW